MKNATLVIMAAGIGSRFGGGIKQLEAVGPNGEIIMDYSIHDALEAGFNKVVFVIRKSLEKDFKEVIGERIERITDVAYAYQELDDIPKDFQGKWEGRKKPWGTGQAILCCKGLVKEPFLVINADDYYGKEAYKAVYQYLAKEEAAAIGDGNSKILDICMAGFVLENTLSSNGAVTRGICHVDGSGLLTDIEETYGIKESDGRVAGQQNGETIELSSGSIVSMNMWGLPVQFLDRLEDGFEKFLSELDEQELKKEYLLPQIIGEMLKNGCAKVKVLPSHDKWFGVTYKEDKEEVVKAIRNLVDQGIYPENLFDRQK